jgi:2',3'-cyclic-nucleotide 2'-phosphodiesterase (5'-nucleotidase family)
MRMPALYAAAALCLCISCSRYYRPASVQWAGYRVSGTSRTDSGMQALLRPYSDSINKTMNRVIATVAEPLERRQPNGSLGLVLADALLAEARKHFGPSVQAAFINNGGIRITSLGAGALTTGKAYEIMPFDNLLVVQEVSGAVLKNFLNHIARRGGWPVAGISFTIKGAAGKETAEDIMVNGNAFNELATYSIANSDYIANGGDDCQMLKTLPQINRNVLMRDAFIHYFSAMQSAGLAIRAPRDNRILVQ